MYGAQKIGVFAGRVKYMYFFIGEVKRLSFLSACFTLQREC